MHRNSCSVWGSKGLVRTLAFDFMTEGDPLAEHGRALGVTDCTSAWAYDGRGTDALQRNVELWIPLP